MQVPLASSVGGLSLPHLGIGLGVGTIDASLFALLAKHIDDRYEEESYTSVYVLSQCSVALSNCLGERATPRSTSSPSAP